MVKNGLLVTILRKMRFSEEQHLHVEQAEFDSAQVTDESSWWRNDSICLFEISSQISNNHFSIIDGGRAGLSVHSTATTKSGPLHNSEISELECIIFEPRIWDSFLCFGSSSQSLCWPKIIQILRHLLLLLQRLLPQSHILSRLMFPFLPKVTVAQILEAKCPVNS